MDQFLCENLKKECNFIEINYTGDEYSAKLRHNKNRSSGDTFPSFYAFDVHMWQQKLTTGNFFYFCILIPFRGLVTNDYSCLHNKNVRLHPLWSATVQITKGERFEVNFDPFFVTGLAAIYIITLFNHRRNIWYMLSKLSLSGTEVDFQMTKFEMKFEMKHERDSNWTFPNGKWRKWYKRDDEG